MDLLFPFVFQRYGSLQGRPGGREGEEIGEEEEELFVVSKDRLITPVEIVGAEKVAAKQG